MPQTPPITKNLIIINSLLYFALIVGERWGLNLNNILGLHFILAPDFQIYQLITYMFMHGSFTHVLFNMFSLWMFGRIIEMTLGSKRFLWFYLLCGLGAGICQECVQFGEYYFMELYKYQLVGDGINSIPMSQYINLWTTIGASGAVYGILVAYGMLYPNERIMLLIPPIPMKAKYMVIGFIVIELFVAISSTGDSIAHFAHLGGALAAWILIRMIKKKYEQQRAGFTTWEEYRPKKTFKEKVNNYFANFKKTKNRPHNNSQTKAESKKPSVEEITHILNKIKTSGYDSLTPEEKAKLFEK